MTKNIRKEGVCKERVLKEGLRKIFITDIHGHYTKFMKLLHSINYSEDDILILGGDYFDRGKENDKMAQWLIDNHHKENIFLIRGNHDDFMIDLFNGKNDSYMFNYKHNGLNTTINNLIKPNRFYDPVRAANMIQKRYPQLRNILENLLNYIEIDDVIYTHGGLPEDYENGTDEDWMDARWSNSPQFAATNTIDKEIVIGHWYISTKPTKIRNVTFCDGAFTIASGIAYVRT